MRDLTIRCLIRYWNRALVFRLEHSGRNRSLSWLLMPRLLMSPSHQQYWYWLCRIKKIIALHEAEFQVPKCPFCTEKWRKILITLIYTSQNNSACKSLIHQYLSKYAYQSCLIYVFFKTIFWVENQQKLTSTLLYHHIPPVASYKSWESCVCTNNWVHHGPKVVFLVCTLQHIIIIIKQTCLKALDVTKYLPGIFCRVCVQDEVHSLNNILCNIWGCVFSAYVPFDHCEDVCISSYCSHHQLRI